MTSWRPTVALGRALLVATAGIGFAVLLGDPVLVVLVAPLVLVAALGLLHRPTSAPRLTSRLDHETLHEGQGTLVRLFIDDAGDVEHVTRLAAAAPYVSMRPVRGHAGVIVDGDPDRVPRLEVSPRRWGTRTLGEEKVGLTAAWAGYRWGPVPLIGRRMDVLPVTAPFDSSAEVPAPVGLVGRHRSRRTGDGSEFASIRPFHAGDKLRRINWRVSLRSRELHVVTARAEQDAGVLLVVDALADHGISGGVDGRASSLDVTVRAAAALAEHHIRSGDRVSMRVVGPAHELVGLRHRSAAPADAARQARPGPAPGRPGTTADQLQLQLRVTAGTVVIVLSPMLDDAIGTATATLAKRGVSVLVVDTLPEDVVPDVADGTDVAVADLAWRMRRVDRDHQLARLVTLGCPGRALARARDARRRDAPTVAARAAAPGREPVIGSGARAVGVAVRHRPRVRGCAASRRCRPGPPRPSGWWASSW